MCCNRPAAYNVAHMAVVAVCAPFFYVRCVVSTSHNGKVFPCGVRKRSTTAIIAHPQQYLQYIPRHYPQCNAKKSYNHSAAGADRGEPSPGPLCPSAAAADRGELPPGPLCPTASATAAGRGGAVTRAIAHPQQYLQYIPRHYPQCNAKKSYNHSISK